MASNIQYMNNEKKEKANSPTTTHTHTHTTFDMQICVLGRRSSSLHPGHGGRLCGGVVDDPLVGVLLDGVQAPGGAAVVVDGGPPQVPAVPALEGAPVGLVQGGPVVPDDHVRGLLPLDADGVVLLRDVVEEFLDQGVGLRFGDPLDVVGVGGDVDVAPAAGLVDLDEPVAGHAARVGRVEVLEELGRPQFAGLRDRVVHHVVLFEEFPLEGGVQRVPGRARVGEVGVAAVAGGRDLDGPEEREARPARVERRVDVEEGVSLVTVTHINVSSSQEMPSVG